MRRLSLKTKMVVPVCLLVGVLIAVAAFLTYRHFERAFKQSIATHQSVLVASLAREIDDKLILSRKILLETAGRFPLDACADAESVQQFLDAAREVHSVFDDGLFLFSPAGVLIAQSPYEPNMRGHDYSFREYFQKTLTTGRPYISLPYHTTKQHANPALMFTVPLFDGDKALVAILAGSFDLMKDNFLGAIATMKIGDTGHLFLAAADGTLIIHPDRGKILKAMPILLDFDLQQMRPGREGTMETENSAGALGISSFSHLQATNWIMAAHFPLKEAYAPIETVRRYAMGVLLGAMILSVLVVRQVMVCLTKPLLRFTRHVAETPGKAGEARYFKLAARDEIGILADTFNGMVDELDRQRAELKKSKGLYQVVADFSTDMAIWCSPTGKMLYVSPQCRPITGYCEQDFYDDPGLLDRLIHVDDRQRWDQHREEVTTEVQRHPLEFRLMEKAGSVRWVGHFCRLVYDEAGEFIGVRGSFSDITARKKAEEQLRVSQDNLSRQHKQLGELFRQVEFAKNEWETTLDCINDIVILADSQGRILRCNRAAVELTGTSYAETLGKDWRGRLAMSVEGSDRTLEQGREVLHGGSGRWFYITCYPFKQRGHEEVSGAVITMHDTTAIKKITSELEKAYDDLKAAHAQRLQSEKLASIGQLAAGVAHEINNPIGYISSNLGSLGKYVEKLTTFLEAQDEALGTLSEPATRDTLAALRMSLKIDHVLEDIGCLVDESREGAERVRNIVQDLKTFSRVDEAEYKQADIVACMESTINIVWNELKYKATINKDYGDIPPIMCYPQQLNQVFMNLLLNAAHAIMSQGTINVRIWQEKGSVFVSVTDTGCGITEEIRNRIFEPFFTTKEVGQGTGLGLSISYDIIQKHKGEIAVESEVGKGTTFTIKLPTQ